jgi:soluble lytic murein transglycosylase-like protein
LKKSLQLALAVALIGVALPSVCAEVAVLDNGFSIRHERREVIGDITRLYLSASEHSGYIDVPTARIGSIEPDDAPPTPDAPATPVISTDAAAPAASPPGTVDDFIKAASEKHRIDRALIESVIHAESRFKPNAVSPKGAQGLMQLMPDTAAALGVNNAFDPRSNVEAGTRYLQQLLIQYNGDLAKALAAYNAGPHRVQQYNGIPPYRETQNYVSNIINDFNRKKIAEGVVPPPPPAKHSKRKSAKTSAKSTGSSSSGQH